MPVQHFVNPGQLYVIGAQPPPALPSECISCTAPHYLHTIKRCDLEIWPMTLIFNRLLEVVKVHVHAKLHEAKCSGSWAIVLTEKKTATMLKQYCCRFCRQHARRSLSTVGGDTQWPNQPPHYCPPLIHLHSPPPLPPPERCKVSQQVWNRVMNWTWTCVSPYCDLLD